MSVSLGPRRRAIFFLSTTAVGYQREMHAATAQPRSVSGGETRKNVFTKKLIVLQLQVTSAVRHGASPR